MKSLKLLMSVLALAALAATPALRAEDDAPPPPPPHKGQHHGGDRLQELTKRLDLTADQQTKIKAILDDEMTATQVARKDASLKGKAKRDKLMEIRKSHNDQILAVLTPEQKAKFKEQRPPHKKAPKPDDAP